MTFDTKGWSHYFRRAARSLSADVTSLFMGSSLLRIRNSRKGANHDTRSGCQETPQIRSPTISFDHRRRQNHLIVCQKADDLCLGRLVRRCCLHSRRAGKIHCCSYEREESTNRDSERGGFLWRRLPWGAGPPHVLGNSNGRLLGDAKSTKGP